MKTIRSLLITGILALTSSLQGADTAPNPAPSPPEPKAQPARPDLIAHEWGTFTQVIGSDGITLPWWTPTLEGPATLPEFVKPVYRITGGKTGYRAWNVRMETPVIYFYADEPAQLTINIDESQVPFTEVFPNVTNPFLVSPGVLFAPAGKTSAPQQPAPATTANNHRQWKVEIQPPHDAIGKAMPPVGEQGAHYRHAREVPEAWWVVGPQPKEGEREVEKFIFYRGAGDATMPRRIAHVGKDSLVFWPTDRPQFIVETDQDSLRWKRFIPTLPDEESSTARTSLPSDDPDARTDEAGLAEALAIELVKDGLTRDEAVAMVATWRESWLGETGLRVLELLPRDWIDETLPMTISPAPAKIERVFVARWELFSPTLETRVLGVFDGPESTEEKMSTLKNLDLGRFGTALFDRVATIRNTQFRNSYRSLVAGLNQLEIAAEESAP